MLTRRRGARQLIPLQPSAAKQYCLSARSSMYVCGIARNQYDQKWSDVGVHHGAAAGVHSGSVLTAALNVPFQGDGGTCL